MQTDSHQCGKPVIGFGTAFYGTQIKRGAYPWWVYLALFGIEKNRSLKTPQLGVVHSLRSEEKGGG